MKIEFDLLEQLADEIQSTARANYSGRAMYGKSCVAITIDGEADLIALGAAIATLVDDEDLKVQLTNGVRMDSMGRGLIAYWPTVSCDDAPEEEEEDY